MGFKAINLSKVTEFETVPVGKYLTTCHEYKEKVSEGAKTAGMDMLIWTLKVAEGDYQGQNIWYTTILDEKYAFSLFNLLKASGLYTDTKLKSENFKFDPDKLLNIQFVVTVEHNKSADGTQVFANVKKIENADTWTGPDTGWGE